MPSTMIHLAAAKMLEEKHNIINKNDYYIGSIVTDIGKLINIDREITHYEINKDKPSYIQFKEKYPNYLKNDFLFGYYVHLYTDSFWDETVIKKLISNNKVKLLNGNYIEADTDQRRQLVYGDYYNLGLKVIDEYSLDLDIFSNKINDVDIDNFNDFDLSRLQEFINQYSLYITTANNLAEKVFDIDIINNFINNLVDNFEI